MKNIILSNHRCGSTYVNNSIKKIEQTFNLSHLDLAEVCNGVRERGWMTLSQNNELILHPYYTTITKRPVPAHELRILNNELLRMMIQTNSSFTAKIHIDHTWMVDRTLFDQLLQQSKVFALYREDVEDALLSKHFMMYGTHTGYNSQEHLEPLRYALETHEALHSFIRTRQKDIHHVIKYEDLDGKDLKKDFQQYFGEIIPDHVTTNKHKERTKEEKIDTLINYDLFKRDFDREVVEYGFIK